MNSAWLGIAQINATVGDIEGNCERIHAARAKAPKGTELLLFPELTVSGYPPEDLVLTSAFTAACKKAAEELAHETAQGPALLVGCPWEDDGKIYNAALLMDEGRIQHIIRKRMLPNYGVFDEKRIFDEGGQTEPVVWRGRKLGILVCEDIWYKGCAETLARRGAESLLVLNASPYNAGKRAQRLEVARNAVATTGLPLAYANMVGGQDDILFDGHSFLLDEKGALAQSWPGFAEASAPDNDPHFERATDDREIWQALVLGLRDYVQKNNFPGVLLGISGGIDSALCAALAVDALGAEKVLGVLLPSAITAEASNEDAHALAKLLGIRHCTLPIGGAFEAACETLAPVMPQVAPTMPDWRTNLPVAGNLQPRLRALYLMALSNASGYMLLNTSNKSEIAVGYSTLYGDSCGGYSPLKDMYKTHIYALARWRNGQGRVIPESSIEKAPTAELIPGQKDEDQLPPYPVLDGILKILVEQHAGTEAAVTAGFERALVEKIADMLRISEYKRRQSPPGCRVSPMIFGRERRFPLTNGFKG